MMIKPGNLKKHLRIYCAVGLMITTTLSLGELTKPSYALLTSTTEASITFSAATSFPEKEMPILPEELIPSETSIQTVDEAAEEHSTSSEDTEQSGVLGEGNQMKQEDQTLTTQTSADNSKEPSVQSDNSNIESTESAINQTSTEGSIN